jgi:hypothetical protein
MGTIVIQDGAGGHGYRGAVVCLFPQSREEIVMQDQVSRTGLLFDSSFQTRDPSVIEELEIEQHKSPLYVTEQGRQLRNDGNSYRKDWFASRAAQAQHILSVAPTRAEITLLNAADVQKGAAPVIVSSFGTTLDTFHYIGWHYIAWKGQDIRTGQKQTLTVDNSTISPPPMESVALNAFMTNPGAFWATATQGVDYIPTLGSIHWSDKPVVYIGPVTNSP